MKFIVSSTALSSHLQAISRVINSKNALPILDCFLFELQDGTLSATVSDSETTMVTTVEVNESDMDGRFAVTAKTLLDAMKENPDQPLTFAINTDSLEITVQYQNGKYSLMGQNADEFPQSAMLGDNAVRVEMDAQVLLGGINRAVFATADDELRPVMNGIYFDITTEDITMVASDGHKLVRCKTLAAKGNDRAAFILPKKPATLLKNLLPKEQGTVTIEFDYIILDCPAGIEQGFKNAIAAADRALIVTTPEVSAIRDADRIIGLLEANDIHKIDLVINRIRMDMVERGDMLSKDDVLDILAVDLIGIVPDDENIVISTNQGEPLDGSNTPAGKAYQNICNRVMGKDVPFMEITGPTFFQRLANVFKK